MVLPCTEGYERKVQLAKKKGDGSANTAVATTSSSDDTPGASETTCGGIGYITGQVACATDSTEDTSSGGWCVDSGATVYFVDPAKMPDVHEKMPSFRTLERSYVTVGGGRKLQTTGFGNLVGTVYKDHGVQVRIEMPGVLIVPNLGRCLFSVSIASRAGIITALDSSNPRLLTRHENISLRESFFHVLVATAKRIYRLQFGTQGWATIMPPTLRSSRERA